MRKDINSILDELFNDFNKWKTYPAAFSLMDAGECSLINIMDAAHRVGITPGVVHMRRSHHLAEKARRQAYPVGLQWQKQSVNAHFER